MSESQQIPKGLSTDFFAFSKLYPEPTFKTKKASGKQWIEFGQDNNLPAYVEDLLDKSPDASGIIHGSILFCSGNGLVKPSDPKAAAMYANGSINRANPNDLNAVQGKLFRDLVVHGGACLNVRWRKDKKGIADVHAVPVTKMRLDAEGDGFWISPDWTNFKKDGNEPEFFGHFDPEAGGSQIIYLRAPSPRSTPYAMPSYWSARESIELQSALMRHNLKRVQNNFMVSAIISYDDVPTAEEQDKMNKSLKDFVVGPDGEFTGGFLTTYGGGVKVTPFDSGAGPKDFAQIQETADQRIRSAFRVCGNGDIFGLARGNETGFNSSDLETEYELYSQTVVRPLQNLLIGVWAMLGELGGIQHQWEIDPFTLRQVEQSVKGAEAATPGGSLPVDASNPVPATDVAATALNGAQIDSLLSIVQAVSSGTLTKETALPLIQAAFPTIPVAMVEAMINGAAKAEPLPAKDVPALPAPTSNPALLNGK